MTEELSKHDFKIQNCGRFFPKLLYKISFYSMIENFFFSSCCQKDLSHLGSRLLYCHPALKFEIEDWECSFVKGAGREVIPRLTGVVTRRSNRR